jgi:hypothetical protein
VRPASRFACAVAGYAIVFGMLFVPWLRLAAEAIPRQPHADDARVIVWIVGWVAHALRTAPLAIADAPIDYPAPAQITGCEHLATSQLVAGPIYWLTGNAVLATNLTTMASYPLGALAMERLVTALGAGGLVAWASGLLFALGPLRVPANVQTLQYPNLFLPLAALALVRLRERPGFGRTLVAAGAIGLGLFGSYYAAVLVTLVAAAWIVLDAPRDGRARFMTLGTLALMLPLPALWYVSRPYLARAATLGPVLTAMAQSVASEAWRFRAELALLTLPRFGAVPLGLAAAGLVGLAPRGPSRRLALAGVVFAAVGFVLSLGPTQPFFGHDVTLPYAIVAASPARFFRSPERFLVLAGFGTALLAAALLVLLPRRVGAAAAVVVAALVVVERGQVLRTWTPDFVLDPTARAAYARVGTVADGGALLELPIEDRAWATLEPDAMIGNTIHHLPLVGGYTGYRAAHRPLLLSLLGRLPAPEAWDALVDLTGARWLLLRPASFWRDVTQRDALAASTGTVVVEDAGWTLLRIARTPERRWWFEALAAGPRPGETVLGTPLVPLASAHATLSLVEAPADVAPRGLTTLKVRVENDGATPWPVAVPADFPTTFAVGLAAEWRAGSIPEPGSPATQPVALPWDLRAGEHVDVDVRVGTPAAGGDHTLALRVVQEGSGAFDASSPLVVPLAITPR